MTIRLAVVSTAKNTNRILQEMQTFAGNDVEVVLHIGGASSDLKASSVTRLNTREGGQGHLFASQRWTGAAQSLIQDPTFLDNLEEFVDQLHRRSEINSYKSHPIRSMQDYVDYYHILADVVGQALLDRKVTHILFFNVPHLAYDVIMLQMAKVLGVQVTIVTQSIFPNQFFSMTDPSDLGGFVVAPKAAPYAMEKGSRPDLFYMKGIKQEREDGGRITGKAIVQLLTFLALKRPLKAFNPVYMWKLVRHMMQVYGGLPKWRDPFARFFHEDELAYFDTLVQFEDGNVDLSGDYVYFPLQLQPEMTTSALGGRFRDQAYAIERLAGMLPEGVRILVKENPKQGGYMRGPMFFHRLRRIQSVTFLPSWADTHALTGGAKFVAAITGTVGWEAIRAGTPALVFGKAWYRSMVGVHQWREGITYDEIIQPFDHADLEQGAGSLMVRTHEGVVDRHYTKIVPEYDEAKNDAEVARTLWGLIAGQVPKTFGKGQ
jgi:hypothetical protein